MSRNRPEIPMNAVRYVPWVLALIGSFTLAAALFGLIGGAAAPSRFPESAIVGGLLFAGVAGATFGLSLLATRLHGAQRQPRALIRFAIGGALAGGFGAFVHMAIVAAGGILGSAVLLLALVLMALVGIGAGARTLRSLQL